MHILVGVESCLEVDLLRNQSKVSENVIPGSILGNSPCPMCWTVGVKVAVIFTNGSVLDTARQMVGLRAGLLTAANSSEHLRAEDTAELRASIQL